MFHNIDPTNPTNLAPLVLDSSWLPGFLIIKSQASSSLSYLLEIVRSPAFTPDLPVGSPNGLYGVEGDLWIRA